MTRGYAFSEPPGRLASAVAAASCVLVVEQPGQRGVSAFRALVAILATACLLSLIGIPPSVAAQGVGGTVGSTPTPAPIPDSYTRSPPPAVSVATQDPLGSESPKRGESADVQPTPESKVDDREPGKPPPPAEREATSEPTSSPVAAAAYAEAQAVVGTPVLLGHSVQGRAILGVELGNGPRWVAAIGGIHQGNEANSTVLANLLLDFFRENLAEIPDGVGLAFFPDVNPDGAVAGTRENANGVDLNRNWDAGWQRDSYGPSGLLPGGGGTWPFSEPETRALARYLLDRPFVAAIFFHSKGGFVVPGPGSGSAELASDIAEAAEYVYLTGWTAYPLSGQASKYLVARGIHAAVVELSTYTDPDFARNLKGLRAALAWAQALPAPLSSQTNAAAHIPNACGWPLGTDRASLASPICPW